MKVTASWSPDGELIDEAAEDVQDDEDGQHTHASRVSKDPIGAARLERMAVDSRDYQTAAV